mmetsp:Transcript_56350/g.158836  ORF Transcript_56350/g.158836 Transcript_56350/m.158836 type:complete len:260 (+) Transcript_56350:2107-2886(+)
MAGHGHVGEGDAGGGLQEEDGGVPHRDARVQAGGELAEVRQGRQGAGQAQGQGEGQGPAPAPQARGLPAEAPGRPEGVLQGAGAGGQVLRGPDEAVPGPPRRGEGRAAAAGAGEDRQVPRGQGGLRQVREGEEVPEGGGAVRQEEAPHDGEGQVPEGRAEATPGRLHDLPGGEARGGPGAVPGPEGHRPDPAEDARALEGPVRRGEGRLHQEGERAEAGVRQRRRGVPQDRGLQEVHGRGQPPQREAQEDEGQGESGCA